MLEAEKPAGKPEKSHTADEGQEAGSHPGLRISYTGTASATMTTNSEALVTQKPPTGPAGWEPKVSYRPLMGVMG